jgi:TrmH family RNA methyltransferase
LDGDNIYKNLARKCIIVMGNEANGISAAIEKDINRLSIPRFGIVQKTESLNVATATGIILSEFKGCFLTFIV